MPRFIQQAIKGEPITVYGDGKQTRSFCDVRDTVKMLDLLFNNDKAVNEVINVGNDHEIAISDLAKLIKKITGSDSPIEYLSYEEAYGEEIDEIMRRKPCLKKLHSLISYQPEWPLERTIKDIASCFKKNE